LEFEEEALMTATGGSVASTGCGIKLRLSLREQTVSQESMCGWRSVRRKGIAGRELEWRWVFTMDSISGVGPTNIIRILFFLSGYVCKVVIYPF
jgi:hypothetical protein